MVRVWNQNRSALSRRGKLYPTFDAAFIFPA